MHRVAPAFLVCLAIVAPALGATLLFSHDATMPVRECALSGDGRVIVVSSDQVHIFQRNGTLASTTWPGNDVAITPSGSLIAIGHDDGVRGLLRNGTELWMRPGGATAVAVSGDGATVAALSPGGSLTIWNGTGFRLGSASSGATGPGLDLGLSRNGSVIVTLDSGGVHAFTRRGVSRWDVEQANPSVLALNETGERVAVGDAGSIKFYDLNGTLLNRARTGDRVSSLAMTPSANLTVAGIQNGTLAAYGPDGALLWSVPAGQRVGRVAVSGSGGLIAVGSDRRLRFFRGNGTSLGEVALAGDPVSLALSVDGSTAVVGCHQGTAYVFGTAEKETETPATSMTEESAAPGAMPDANATNDLAVRTTLDVPAATPSPPTVPDAVVDTSRSMIPPLVAFAFLALIAIMALVGRSR